MPTPGGGLVVFTSVKAPLAIRSVAKSGQERPKIQKPTRADERWNYSVPLEEPTKMDEAFSFLERRHA